MRNLDLYILEKLKINKDSKLLDYKEVPINKRFLGKCLMILTTLGENNFNKKNYLEVIDINKFYIYKDTSDEFKTHVKITFNVLSNILLDKDIKLPTSHDAFIDNENDRVIYFTLNGSYIIYIINNVESSLYLDKFIKDKQYNYKEFVPAANIHNSICKFEMTEKDFDIVKSKLNN